MNLRIPPGVVPVRAFERGHAVVRGDRTKMMRKFFGILSAGGKRLISNGRFRYNDRVKISRGPMLATAGAAAIGLLGILVTRGHVGVEPGEDASAKDAVHRPGRETRSERFSRLKGAIAEQEKLCNEWLRANPGRDRFDWPHGFQRWKLLHELAESCGVEGERWLEQNDPESLGDYKKLWMQLRPREMLDFVESSSERPCSKGQLEELLQVCANGDGVVLRAECRKIQWDLFFDSDGSMDRRIYAQEYAQGHPDDGYHYLDTELWGQSGAARDLAEQGIEMYHFFESWSQADPKSALENCMDWPDADGTDAENRLRQCLWSAEPADFQKLSPEMQERMKPLILEMVQNSTSHSFQMLARAVAVSLGLQVPEPTSPPEPGY